VVPSRRLMPLLVLAGALAVSAAASWARAPGDVLVRLPKQQPVEVPSAVLSRMAALQELDTAWLALASPELVASLRAAGASIEILDAAPAGKAHHLVFTSDARAMNGLRLAGDAWLVDDGVWLLATRHGDARERAPLRAAIKPLGTSVPSPTGVGVGASAPPDLEALALPAASRVGIAEMVAQVSRERLAADIRGLEAFSTRHTTTSNSQAAALAIRDELLGLGLATEMEDFPVGTTGRTAGNVIATLPGRAVPSVVVLVSAHYDSTSDQSGVLAPGADDNASGTAAVIELARVLSAFEFDFTLRFAAWGAEEQGLVGSRYHAQRALERGEVVLADLTLDMIGYVDQAPEDLELIVHPSSDWVYQRFAAAVAAYAPLPVVPQVRATFGSDCTSFWERGYPALCAIEDYPLKNPYYHRTTDRIETLDPDFVASVTAATLAAAADLAQPVGSPQTPSALTAESRGGSSSLTSTKEVSLSWNGVAGASGYHVYRSTRSHRRYERVTASPVEATTYLDGPLDSGQRHFYVVTAVDAAGRESNFSAESREDALRE
jgi:hypothetical protein